MIYLFFPLHRATLIRIKFHFIFISSLITREKSVRRDLADKLEHYTTDDEKVLWMSWMTFIVILRMSEKIRKRLEIVDCKWSSTKRWTLKFNNYKFRYLLTDQRVQWTKNFRFLFASSFIAQLKLPKHLLNGFIRKYRYSINLIELTFDHLDRYLGRKYFLMKKINIFFLTL